MHGASLPADERGLPALEALQTADVGIFFVRFLKLDDFMLILYERRHEIIRIAGSRVLSGGANIAGERFPCEGSAEERHSSYPARRRQRTTGSVGLRIVCSVMVPHNEARNDERVSFNRDPAPIVMASRGQTRTATQRDRKSLETRKSKRGTPAARVPRREQPYQIT